MGQSYRLRGYAPLSSDSTTPVSRSGQPVTEIPQSPAAAEIAKAFSSLTTENGEPVSLSWTQVTLLPGTSRSADRSTETPPIVVDDSSVIAVQFDDDTELLLSADEYRADFVGHQVERRGRGGSGNDAFAAEEDVIYDVSASLPPDRGWSSEVGRGDLTDLIKSVTIHKCANKLGKELTVPLARSVDGWFMRGHKSFLNEKGDLPGGSPPDPRGVLLKCSLEDRFQLSAVTDQIRSKPRLLLFIHGTLSNTEGSFGRLWKAKDPGMLGQLYEATTAMFGRASDPSADRRRENRLAQLRDYFDDNAVAFEHPTLTFDPVDNAIALVEQLPEGAELYIVSHSRGGLIGELLCRGQRVDEFGESIKPFDQQDEKLWLASWQESQDAAGDSPQRLQSLEERLVAKKITIKRFVRVACPALGTTLASNKAHRWLNWFSIALKRSAVLEPVVLETLAVLFEFTRAIVSGNTDPGKLPGLAAMMPGGPLVKMLNCEGVRTLSDLSIIAGAREGGSLLRRLPRKLLRALFDGDHDLVVNTGSMYGGAERVAQPRVNPHSHATRTQSAALVHNRAMFYLDRGDSVSHFRYFRNEETACRLVERLTQQGDGQFESIRRELIVQPARSAKVGSGGVAEPVFDHISGTRPVVVVLPGIMGSQLSVDQQPVWVKLSKLMFGGLNDLRYDAADATAVNPHVITADGLLDDAYGRILPYLHSTHDVVRFPYDWRLSVSVAADRLAEKLESVLGTVGSNQPIRFLAHSMGGLVLAALISRKRDLWQRISQHEQSRTVLLGTPLQGSWSIVQLLFGMDDLIGKLALLDLTSSQRELLDVIRKFPGVLELLPVEQGTGAGSCFDPDRWKQWGHALRGSAAGDRNDSHIAIPSDEALDRAARTVSGIQQVDWSREKVVYVAGQSSETTVGLNVEPGPGGARGRIRLLTSDHGDGRVAWDLAPLNGVPRYYMPVEHGSLADSEDDFPAIVELLQCGTTNRISRSKPATRGADMTRESILDEPPLVSMFPTAQSLTMSALGSRRLLRGRIGLSGQRRILVRVVHGDLAFARFPVMVGHYYGDPLVGAERRLDEAFNGTLSYRQALGLYAGNLRTCEIFLSREPRHRPAGSIIVGLGQAGELTAAKLEQTIAHAVLEYAVTVSEHTDNRFDDSENARRVIRLSALLIGTAADSLSVSDALEAMLRGIDQATRRLEDMSRQPGRNRARKVEITEIEFIDLYLDKAVEAMRSATRLVTLAGFRERFQLDGQLQVRSGHRQRLVAEDFPGWWHRLQITCNRESVLEFVSLTRRARAEVRELPTQQSIVQHLVDCATGDYQTKLDVCRTLFEILLPNALKESASWIGNVQLILDEAAAALPWELLQDRDSPTIEPPAVASGLLRQLRSRTFRERPVDALLKSACVIAEPRGADGKPIPGIRELPAAREEGRIITELLRDHGYDVESQIEKPCFGVITALHAREYRILHLAGHGVHEWLPKDAGWQQNSIARDARSGRTDPEIVHQRDLKSGMIIGQDLYFTPQDAEQMRVVPDLVFINCCFLGRTTKSADSEFSSPDLDRQRTSAGPQQRRIPRNNPPEYAANVATQFIRMGARAVVCAGWLIDDQAALTFARSFYHSILSGLTFGESVRHARRETWQSHPLVNTWGAFQCYGDPGWRLVPRDTRNGYDTQPDREWVSPVEAVLEFENMAQQARTSTIGRTSELQQELRRLQNRLPREWRNRADVAGHLGFAWAELGHFERAARWLVWATWQDVGEGPIRIVERLCDTLNRLVLIDPAYTRSRLMAMATAPEVSDTDTSDLDGNPPDAADTANQPDNGHVPELLDWSEQLMNKLLATGETTERFLIQSSTYRRMAVFVSGKKRLEHLANAAEALRKAVMHPHAEDSAGNSREADDGWRVTKSPLYTLHTVRVLLSILTGQPAPAAKDVKERANWLAEQARALSRTSRNSDAEFFREPPRAEDPMKEGFDVRQVTAWCGERRIEADVRAQADPSFWHCSWQGGCPLLELLLTLCPVREVRDGQEVSVVRMPTRSAELIRESRDGYRFASRQGASKRERNSVVQHLQFVAAVLSDPEVPGTVRIERTAGQPEDSTLVTYPRIVHAIGDELNRLADELDRDFKPDNLARD